MIEDGSEKVHAALESWLYHRNKTAWTIKDLQRISKELKQFTLQPMSLGHDRESKRAKIFDYNAAYSAESSLYPLDSFNKIIGAIEDNDIDEAQRLLQ